MSRKKIIGGQFNKVGKGRIEWIGECLLEDVEQSLKYIKKLADAKVSIKEVRYVEDAGKTIVTWNDGKKTVAKCHPDDKFDRSMGLAICVLKKLMTSNEYYALFHNWAIEGPDVITVNDVRNYIKGNGMIYTNNKEIKTVDSHQFSFEDYAPNIYINNNDSKGNCKDCGFEAAI